jgi:hypothetical protein
MALPKNSPYKTVMDNALIKMREIGPWQLLRSRFEEEIPNCKGEGRKATPLGMEKIFTLFLLMASGAIGGLILLILEICFRPPAKNVIRLSKFPFVIDSAITMVKQIRQMTLPHLEDEDNIILKLEELRVALEKATVKTAKMGRD